MDNSSAPGSVSPVGLVPQPKTVKRIKIGEVARHFEVSVDLLRLYERESGARRRAGIARSA